MRIALVPLDNRPPNWLFPQRLAAIAGVEVILPPREMLGSLHHAAAGESLARWLRDTVNGSLGGQKCQAAIFSWDALIYGGLIQSRQLEPPTPVRALTAILSEIDWSTTTGYAYATVPRLGLSITTADVVATHQAVREYFICHGARTQPKAAARLTELEEQLGEHTIATLWRWRDRNHTLACEALRAGAVLGLQHCHIAVEDNAPTGPHLAEVERLRHLYFDIKREHPLTACSFFDGADECASLLMARAVIDHRSDGSLPVQLTVHPASPGPDRYTGLYETHSLGDGLTFLSRFLNLQYHYTEQPHHWLVAHGVQPQPDVFADAPGKVFANPFLLPKRLPEGGRLFVTDLAACNGANPRLAAHAASMYPGGVSALVGYNTNFNALGISAAWLRLAPPTPGADDRRFLVERLADDVVYQSIARPAVLKYLHTQGLDAMDFADAYELQHDECRRLVARYWRDWLEGPGQAVVEAAGMEVNHAAQVKFSFPWHRAFEVEARLDS